MDAIFGPHDLGHVAGNFVPPNVTRVSPGINGLRFTPRKTPLANSAASGSLVGFRGLFFRGVGWEG